MQKLFCGVTKNSSRNLRVIFQRTEFHAPFLKFDIRIDLLMGFIRKYPSIILFSPDHTSAVKFREVSAAQITPSYTILRGSYEIIKVNSTPKQAMNAQWGSCIALLFL